jgi:hypothetical protein
MTRREGRRGRGRMGHWNIGRGGRLRDMETVSVSRRSSIGSFKASSSQGVLLPHANAKTEELLSGGLLVDSLSGTERE